MKKTFKGFIMGVVIATLLMSTVLGASAKETIEVVFNSINLSVNGKKVEADNILYKGTTYVPLRATGDMLGKSVGWDEKTRTASIDDKTRPLPKEGIKVFENEKVKISYLNTTSKGMEFMVENKTDVVLTIQADTLAVNGLSISDYITMSDDVAPKSKGKVLARVKIENYDETIEKISGQLRVIDFSGNWDSFDATFVNVNVN